MLEMWLSIVCLLLTKVFADLSDIWRVKANRAYGTTLRERYHRNQLLCESASKLFLIVLAGFISLYLSSVIMEYDEVYCTHHDCSQPRYEVTNDSNFNYN